VTYNVTDRSDTRLDLNQLASLIKAAQSDKERHFADLYRYAWPHVLYFATGLLKGRDESEDLAQRVFLYLYEHVEEIRNPQAGLAYINRVTTSIGQNLLVSKRRYMESSLEGLYEKYGLDSDGMPPELTLDELQQGPLQSSIPGSNLKDEEHYRRVYDLVLELPETLRECVFLRYWGEYHNKEIADILGVSENVVAVRLKRARKRLREELGPSFRESGEGKAAGPGTAALSIGVSLAFMARKQQLAAPQRGLWMSGGPQASSPAAQAALPGEAGTTGAGSAGSAGSAGGLGAKGVVALILATAVIVGGVSLGRLYAAGMNRTGEPSAAVAQRTPEVRQEPFSRKGAEEAARAISDPSPDETATTSVLDSFGVDNPTSDGVPRSLREDFRPALSQVAKRDPLAPVITLSHATVRYPVGSAPTRAQVLADSGAQARAADGSLLTLRIHDFGQLGQMNRLRSFLVFLHAIDSAGRQAAVKTLEITVAP